MTSNEFWVELLKLIITPPAIAVAAIYFAKSPMLRFIREPIDRWNRWVGFALKCAFCLCGWISLMITFLYPHKLLIVIFNGNLMFNGLNVLIPVNFILSWGALWGLSALVYRHLWPFLEKSAPKMRIK